MYEDYNFKGIHTIDIINEMYKELKKIMSSVIQEFVVIIFI